MKQLRRPWLACLFLCLLLVIYPEAYPFIEEALTLGVDQFSFTGGEPFVNRDLVSILGKALSERPCLVLTNDTEPLLNRMCELIRLQNKPQPLRFRISLDYPDPAQHDAGRGQGKFHMSLKTLIEDTSAA